MVEALNQQIEDSEDEFSQLESESEQCMVFMERVTAFEQSFQSGEKAEESKVAELSKFLNQNYVAEGLSKNGKMIESMKAANETKYDVPLMQIMDEIYDEYLVDLPESLNEALKLAQDAKEKLYKKYIDRIVEIKEDSEGSSKSSTGSEEEVVRVDSLDDQTPTKRQSSIQSEQLKVRLSTRRLSSLNFEELDFQWSQQKQARLSEQDKKANQKPSEETAFTENYAQVQKQEEKFTQLHQHSQKVESEINKCLVCRITEEQRFQSLDSLEKEIYKLGNDMFTAKFDREKLQEIIQESEHRTSEGQTKKTGDPESVMTIDKYISKFWQDLEARFQTEFMDQQLTKIIGQDNKTDLPEFFTSHFKLKVVEQLQVSIGQFQLSFMTHHEEQWNEFVQEELAKAKSVEDPQSFTPDDLNMKALQTAFAIMVMLPLKRHIKHDLLLLETKISQAWRRLKFNTELRFQWDGSRAQLESLGAVLASLVQSSINLQTTKTNLFRLLFTIFNAFVATEVYDGADRHFLKMFLETCTPVFRQLLEVNEGVSLHFFLMLFEIHVTERIPQDTFDLRKLVYAFPDPQKILEELKITHSMPRCVHLELVRVSKPAVKSKHVIICISGFLQEKEDKADTWKNVAKYYKYAEVYALSWTACNAGDFFNKGVYDPEKTSSYKSVLNFTNLFNTAQKQYIFAYDQARLSGSVLAIFLLKSKFFKGRAVSLIGFSLGTVATMHCARILKGKYRQGFVKASKILTEVQLWAGAYVIDPKQRFEERMRAAFHLSVVSGRVSNLYSHADTVVKYAQPLIHQEANTVAIGIQEILTDVPDDLDGKIGCKKAWNLDVTKEAGGHSGYREGCLRFFPMIPWAY